MKMYFKFKLWLLSLFIFTNVNATIYYVDASRPDNLGAGTSWSTAKKDIQTALYYATTAGDEVWIKAGTYTAFDAFGSSDPRDAFFKPMANIKIYGGFAGTETALSQRNIILNTTILNGNNNYHTMIVYNVNITLDGVTIEGGKADGNGSISFSGTERGFGGGLVINTSTSTISNVIFKNNTASYGGAVFNQNSVNANFINCIFTNNSANNFGGAIENFTGATTNYINCVIANNSSNKGAAITDNGSTSNYINCTIVKNSPSSINTNGVLYNLNNTSSNYKNCIIWGNTNYTTEESGSTINISFSTTQVTSPGSSNLNSDPQLFDILDGDGLDNKWLTADDGFKITVSSNCLNSGNNTAIPSFITLDILNAPRIAQSVIDRGAYESPGATVTQSQVNTSNGQSNGSATVNVSGATGTVTYNWLPCGTNSTNTLSNLAAGNYHCAVMDGNVYLQTVTFTILPSTSTIIYVNKNNTNSIQDGKSWTTAYNNFQNALNDAMSNNILKEIWVAKGTYTPSTTIHNQTSSDPRDKSFYLEGTTDLKIYGGFIGNETTLSARDFKNNTTILSGNIANSTDANTWSYHVFSTISTTNLILNGLVITEGNANGTGDIYNINRGIGGAFVHSGFFSQTNITEINSVIFSNCKGFDVPSLYCQSGNLNLFNSVIENCTASNNLSSIARFNNRVTGTFNAKSVHKLYNVVMTNCDVENPSTNSTTGIYFSYSEGNSGLYHSTIVNNNFGAGRLVLINGETYPGSVILGFVAKNTNVLIKNNIMHNNGNATGVFGVGNNGSNPLIGISTNDYSSSNSSNLAPGVTYSGGDNIFLNPLFLNENSVKGTDGKWFTNDDGLNLTASSPVINPALPLLSISLPNDIRGANRAIGNPDMGAYEYDSTLGLTDNPLSNEYLKIYPNPTNSEINVELGNNISTNAIVFDVNGRELQNMSIKNNFKINLSNYPNGIYFIKFVSEKGTLTKQIIKE